MHCICFFLRCCGCAINLIAIFNFLLPSLIQKTIKDGNEGIWDGKWQSLISLTPLQDIGGYLADSRAGAAGRCVCHSHQGDVLGARGRGPAAGLRNAGAGHLSPAGGAGGYANARKSLSSAFHYARRFHAYRSPHIIIWHVSLPTYILKLNIHFSFAYLPNHVPNTSLVSWFENVFICMSLISLAKLITLWVCKIN